MKQKILMACAAMCIACTMDAASIDSVLHCIEQNNIELKALKKDYEAGCLEIKSQNNLEDPSVEYSPFFNKAVNGVASSELVVSQGFDFPTVYAARTKSGRLQQEVLRQEYNKSRRDILFNAKTLCLDFIMQTKKKTLLKIRGDNALRLLQMYEKRLEDGNANILEVNKIKMDLMNVRTEIAQAEAERIATINSLSALNGNSPLPLNGMEYPATPDGDGETLLQNALNNDNDIHAAAASAKASEQDVKVNKQNWMPKLQVGYRRNTDGSDASNGFLVGASFPLFSSRNKTKAAKAKMENARLNLENTKAMAENGIKTKIQQMKQLKQAAQAYDEDLMIETLRLLDKAVESGQISIVEYYSEADVIYRNLQASIEAERQYHGVMADICKNDI